jgi:hypothetical protein
MDATEKNIVGYEGPTGAYVVARGEVVSLTNPAGILALTDAALLTALGGSEKAAEYSDLAESHGAVAAS